MKIGILTSGGDCPGLNAVIRAIGLYALNNMENVEIVGIPEGTAGSSAASAALCGDKIFPTYSIAAAPFWELPASPIN